MGAQQRKLFTSLSPALLNLYDISNSVVVIIDVLRATSTIATALYNGAEAVMPVATVPRCIELGAELNGITAGELERTRNHVIAESVYLLDSQDKLARIFGVALATGQTTQDVLNWDDDLATVTVEDINKAARTVLDRKASVTGVLLPEEKSQ